MYSWKPKMDRVRSELRLRCLESSHHQITNIASSLVEIEVHTFQAETLANNVELNAILVNYVSKTPTVVNNLAPAVAVKVLAGKLRATDIPCARVCECWITEDRRHLLARSEALL
jgi:hypothetical protein